MSVDKFETFVLIVVMSLDKFDKFVFKVPMSVDKLPKRVSRFINLDVFVVLLGIIKVDIDIFVNEALLVCIEDDKLIVPFTLPITRLLSGFKYWPPVAKH